MKKILLFISFAAALFLASCDIINEGDRIVNLPPVETDRTVLLIDFTGWNCVNCPDAVEITHKILEDYPENLIVVGMHPNGHGFTDPKSSGPDFRSDDAFDYLSYFGGSISTGLPCGVVNNNTYNDVTLLGRDLWTPVILGELARETECLIDLSLVDNDATPEVEIKITPKEGYDGSDVSVIVWLIENDIVALQNSTKGYINDYHHNHVFRGCQNGLWGEEIGTLSTDGKTMRKTITVDDEYVLDNCAAVVAVINTQTKTVLQTAEISLKKNNQ